LPGRDDPSREQLPRKRRKGETDGISFLADSYRAEAADGPSSI